MFVLSLFLFILCYSFFFSSHLRSLELELKNVPLPHRMSCPIEIGEVLSQKNGTQKFLRQWPAWISFHSTSRKRIDPRNKKTLRLCDFSIAPSLAKAYFSDPHSDDVGVVPWQQLASFVQGFEGHFGGDWRFLVIGCFEPKKKHVSVGFVFRERAEMTQRENRMKKDTTAVPGMPGILQFAICWWNCSWMSCK